MLRTRPELTDFSKRKIKIARVIYVQRQKRTSHGPLFQNEKRISRNFYWCRHFCCKLRTKNTAFSFTTFTKYNL